MKNFNFSFSGRLYSAAIYLDGHIVITDPILHLPIEDPPPEVVQAAEDLDLSTDEDND